MRQFNLEEALKGAKVVTRDGKEVISISTESSSVMFPIAAVFSSGTLFYTVSGRYNFSHKNHPLDLMMKDEERLSMGDSIQFLYEGEILEGKVAYVLKNNRIIARSNGSNHVFANVGMYDVSLIKKNNDE